MNGIATRLKCALGDTGFTQKELAQMTGLTEVSISRYINGSRVPKATTLARIADALGVGMGYFFDSVAKDTNVLSKDIISRQDAVDAVQAIDSLATLPDGDAVLRSSAVEYVLYHMPTAQPTPTNTPNALETLDCVSRQAVIDAIRKYDFFFPQYMERFVTELGGAMKSDLVNDIKALPAAQPEVQLSPIEQALHGLRPEAQAEFLINLMRGTLAYIGSRAALIKWLERGYWNGKTG